MFMNPIPIQLSLFSMSENKLESIFLSNTDTLIERWGWWWLAKARGRLLSRGRERKNSNFRTDPLLMLLPLLPSFRHIPLTDQGERG